MGGRGNSRRSAVRGATVDNSIYVRIALDCEDKDPVHMIKGLILECFFGSNVLLNFGALGYSECRVNLIRGDSDVARFIIQVQIRNLRKILTIAANRFPARLHIQLSELVGIAKPIALQVVKYNTNLWSVAV